MAHPSPASHTPSQPTTFAENRRARFDYEIGEAIEAGIELSGFEVKSVRAGAFQIAGAQVLIRGGEAWLVNSHLPAYQPKNTPTDYEEDHARRLLLSRAEIMRLQSVLHDKSVRIVPLRCYPAHGLIKLELGIGRSRRKSDMREALKAKAARREMRGL